MSGDDEATVIERPRPPDQTSQMPNTIGRFVVERTLGQGGMGVVVLAHDPTLDRSVAIKLLRDDRGAADSADRMRMLREAQAMARLRHPNVVTVYEAGVQDGGVYLVVEYIAGGTLRDKLPALDLGSKLHAFLEAGRGLAAAHRAGLVHRDFKPDNVLIDEAGHAKVTDFGLAARDITADEPERPSSTAPELDALSQTLTRTGAIMGTPRYMAPEQHTAGPTDGRTDQFAFCVALYEALFGEHPFVATSRDTLRASVLDEPPKKPDSRGVPARVTAAIMRGLSRDIGARFPSMDALLAELDPPRRHGRAIAGGALAVAVIGGLTYALLRSPDAPVEGVRAPGRVTDHELLELRLPPFTKVVGVRSIGSTQLGPALAPEWEPTGQLALPRGAYAIDYRDTSGTYSYAVISRGGAATRTITLPTPERVAGYVFVPGGEVEIGDAEHKPVAAVQLAPFLIADREHPELASYDDALRVAIDRHARLPTAAEWEWAARLQAVPAMIEDGERWEWTASQLAPYPYAADDRDDPFAPRDRSEVRGGVRGQPAARRAGSHRGKAQLRLARSAVATPRADTVTFELATEPVTDEPTGGIKLRVTIPPREHARLARFLVDWIQLAERPPLRVEGGNCDVTTLLQRAGVPYARIDEAPPLGDPAHPIVGRAVTIRWHPDRTFSRPVARPGQVVVCDDETEILDGICFAGDRIHPASFPAIDATAATLEANPSIRLVEVQSYVGPVADAAALSQRRAELVRRRLIEIGIAADRLRARGYGAAAPSSTDSLFMDPLPPRMPIGCPPTAVGERIAFLIVDRVR